MSGMRNLIHPLDHQISYNDCLPYLLHVLESPLEDTVIFEYNRCNEFTLQTLLALDDSGKDGEDTGTETPPEYYKLDSKLNLLLHWMGKLILQNQHLPTPLPIVISAQGVQITSKTPLEKGQSVVVELYLNDQFPQPLRLPAIAVNDVLTKDLNSNTIVSFQYLTDHCSDLITKLIFRRHRRQIAQQKRVTSSTLLT